MAETKRQHELYQVYATEKSSGELIPVPWFPRANKEACEGWCETIKLMIASGKENRYADPQVIVYLGTPEPKLILEH